jgi:hypothetical protein
VAVLWRLETGKGKGEINDPGFRLISREFRVTLRPFEKISNSCDIYIAFRDIPSVPTVFESDDQSPVDRSSRVSYSYLAIPSSFLSSDVLEPLGLERDDQS